MQTVLASLLPSFGSQLPAATATPEPTDSADAAVETTIDIVAILLSSALGVAAGIVVAFLLIVLLRLAGRRRMLWTEVAHYCRNAIYATAMVGGAYIGTRVALGEDSPAWSEIVPDGLLIAFILASTWLVARLSRAIEATIVGPVRAKGVETRTNRVTTQTQILRRVTEVIIILLGLVGAIMTFPDARVAMGSLLASAGLVSVIAGLAAQSTLGNIFAGIQLATTDAIRVGDVVVVQDEYGKIEEITLTYVVVHIWDDRRLILPSTYFTENPYVNWTRRGNAITGIVYMDLDWRTPISAMRAQMRKIVAASNDWDGREANLLITDTSGGNVTVRITLSGADPSRVWNLQCDVREALIAWLQAEAPYALPRSRVEIQQVEVTQDPTAEHVARLAEELVDLSSTGQGRAVDEPAAADPKQDARLRAAARRGRRPRSKRPDAAPEQDSMRTTVMPVTPQWDSPDDVQN